MIEKIVTCKAGYAVSTFAWRKMKTCFVIPGTGCLI